MPVSHRIDITVGGGDRRPTWNAGNVARSKSSLNTKKSLSEDSEVVTTGNLSKLFTVGMAFNLLQRGGEATGAYTNNRLGQRKFERNMTFAKYGIGIALNPVIGGAYAGIDMGYRGLMYGIRQDKKNREARYYRNLSGNTSASGRRYMGDRL